MKRFLTYLAALALLFTGMGLARAATLYGVSGEGTGMPESLFILSQTDASESLALGLGAGNGGETIAFDPVGGLMYHASGVSTSARFESIGLGIPSVLSSVAFSGAFAGQVNAMTFNPVAGSFLLTSNNQHLYSVTPGGLTSDLGIVSTQLKGLAFVGTTLYGAAVRANELRTINPLNGATLSTLAFTLPGFTIAGATGLATNPDTGELWGVLKDNSVSSVRHLVTIDPATGAATEIGALGQKFSGIAFVSVSPVPEPGSALMLAAGLVGLFGFYRKTRTGNQPAPA